MKVERTGLWLTNRKYLWSFVTQIFRNS
jgi:hypothetical protein